MRWMPCLLTLAVLGGCHARFKKHVGSIKHVRAEMVGFGDPTVNLGYVNDDSLVAAAVNIGQAVKSEGLTQRVGKAVRPDAVADAFVVSLDESMKKRPFEVRDTSRHTLQIEMLHYGIDVPGLGNPGALNYVLRTQLYKGNGKKVYKASHTCSLSFAQFKPVSVTLGTTNNAKAIKELKNKEIRALFEEGAAACADLVVARIRQHGG